MIELYDANFVFLGPIDTALRWGYDERAHDLSTAEIVLAARDPINAQIIVPASWARLWDGDEELGFYRFKSILEDEHADGGEITYALESAQCTLLDDLMIGHHELGGTGLDTRWVMDYILARQTTARWRLGDCDFADQYQYNFEDVTLLEAMMSLREVITGDCAMIFDCRGLPPWTVHFKRLNGEAACSLVYGRNATAIRRSLDGRIVTRLVGRGYGEGDNQLTIAGINGGKDYLDADTMSAWGVRVGIHADRRQTDPHTLRARMAAILEGGKRPRASYTATALDLYAITGQRWDSHRVHDMVLVLDELAGEVIKTRITQRSKRDVSGDGAAVTLTLDSSSRDVADELNEVLDKIGVQELYSQGATNMYSQQISDSADAEHPLEMSFYVPGNVVRINSCLMRWQLERFRSYAKLASSGGGSSQTSQSGGGATVTIPSQTIRVELQSGDAVDSDGGSMDKTGRGGGGRTGKGGSHSHLVNSHSHSFSGSAGIGHNHSLAGDGASATGAIYSGVKTVEISGTTGSKSPGTSTADEHTHSIPDHNHAMDHRHSITHQHVIPALEFTLSGHSHSVTIPSHTHELEYGIYEGNRGQSVTILVDGEEIPAQDVGEDKEIDIAAYMRKDADGKIVRGSWHKVEFRPDTLTRITANLFFQVFIQSRGAGDY